MDKTANPFGNAGEMPGADPKDIPTEAADKTVAAVLGEIVWLMSQSKEHRHLTVADIEAIVMPPILLKQFRIFYKETRPVGAVLFARASREVVQKITSRTSISIKDWNSGNDICPSMIIAPFGDTKDFIRYMTEEIVKTKF